MALNEQSLHVGQCLLNPELWERIFQVKYDDAEFPWYISALATSPWVIQIERLFSVFRPFWGAVDQTSGYSHPESAFGWVENLTPRPDIDVI